MRRLVVCAASLEVALVLAGCCGACPDGEVAPPQRVSAAGASLRPETREDGSVVLSKPGRSIHNLASDKKHLYWAEGFGKVAQVMRVAKKGGETKTIAELDNNITTILPDGKNLYVATWGGIFRVRARGGAPKPLTKGVTNIYTMAMDAKHLYYCAGEGIHRIRKTGKGHKLLVKSDRCLVMDLGVHDGSLYWLDNRVQAVKRVNVHGGEGETFAKDVFPTDDKPILFRGGYAYFYRAIPNAFLRKALKGGPTEVITKPRGFFTGYAVDDHHLYYGRGWTTIGAGQKKRLRRRIITARGHVEGEGGVMRVPLGGGEPTNLSRLAGKVRGIALDNESVYWLDADLGLIVKKAK